VAGIALAVLLLVLLIDDVGGDFVRLDGARTVRLDEGQGRGIWVYDESASDVSGFCSAAAGTERAEMKRTTGVRVTTGGREYHSFLRFQAPADGAYTVSCATSRPVALGPYVTGLRLFAGVAGILGAFFGGLLLAGLIVAGVLILRERSTRRLELEARAGTPAGG
jgi:hypothetical protein